MDIDILDCLFRNKIHGAFIAMFPFHDAISTSAISYRILIDVETTSCVYWVEEEYFQKIVVKHS